MKRATLTIPSTLGDHELVQPLKGRVANILVDDLDQICLVVASHTNDATTHRRWFVVRADPCDLAANERYLGCVMVGGLVRHVFEVPFKVVATADLVGDE